MMFIDMTKELAPFLYGLNIALVVSAVAIVGNTAMNAWFKSMQRIERPRLVTNRPALAR